MYTISAANLSDIPELLPLINSAYRGEASRQGWTTEADFLAGDLRTDEAELAELLSRPDAVILKACDPKGAIHGCVFLEKRGARLYLGMLSVWPELQNKGIGKVLLRGAEEHARNTGCQAIYMQVVTLRDTLIAWYERHGYRVTGERKPWKVPEKYGVPLQPIEFVILEKII